MLDQAQRILKDVFGYDAFRGNQGAIIQRVADGGDDDPFNLQALCACCHAHKTRTERGACPPEQV